MNVFFLAILFYLLYRLFTGFLIPVFRTTRHVRQQFNQKNGQTGGQAPQSPGATPPDHSGKTTRDTSRPNTSKVGEYIDFEEVK
ncbi:MAG TPA: DUF4834 family protein [Puia sp.]|nr:DUF4834 family protein [Puia sp.]